MTQQNDKYNKILAVMLNIVTVATSHGASQFIHYLEAMRQTKEFMRNGSDLDIAAPKKRAYKKEEETRVGNEEPPEKSHQLAPVPPKNTGKFQNLRFQPKVKARGAQGAY